MLPTVGYRERERERERWLMDGGRIHIAYFEEQIIFFGSVCTFRGLGQGEKPIMCILGKWPFRKAQLITKIFISYKGDFLSSWWQLADLVWSWKRCRIGDQVVNRPEMEINFSLPRSAPLPVSNLSLTQLTLIDQFSTAERKEIMYRQKICLFQNMEVKPLVCHSQGFNPGPFLLLFSANGVLDSSWASKLDLFVSRSFNRSAWPENHRFLPCQLQLPILELSRKTIRKSQKKTIRYFFTSILLLRKLPPVVPTRNQKR